MHKGLKELGIEIEASQMGGVFAKFDTDGNFKLDIQEFYEMYRAFKSKAASVMPDATPPAAAAPPSLPPAAKELYESVFDLNADGQLSV